ncbi:hypothetical protein [Acidilobus sp.]|uniref:hypothetical protein n=1 Tax=Acidilobus sp. TaxID=1872109 RepID=UPI003CFF4DAD
MRAPEIVVDARQGTVKSEAGESPGKILYLTLKDREPLSELIERVGSVNNLCTKSKLNMAPRELSQKLDDFLSIYCISRVTLRVRDKLKDFYDRQRKRDPNAEETFKEVMALLPVKPNSVHFTLEVRAEPGYEDLAKSFVRAAVFTLYYLGVGSAANRGFGRFMLKGKLINGYAELLEKFKKIAKSNVNNIDPTFPMLQDSQELGSVNGRVEDALACIGNSTMKVNWKLIEGKSYTTPGFDYNTWVLGLPRQGSYKDSLSEQKINNIERQMNNIVEESHRNKIVVKESKSEKSRQQGIPVEIITGYTFFDEDDNVIQRRQSYVVLTVTEGSQQFKIMAIKFIPKNVGDEIEIIKKGYHIGFHSKQKSIDPRIVLDRKTHLNSKSVTLYIDEAIEYIEEYIRNRCRTGSKTPPASAKAPKASGVRRR